MSNNQIKIFIADDHKLLRESLVLLLSQEDDMAVVGEAEDGVMVEQEVVKADVDVLILDISMPKRSGLDVAKNLLKLNPNLKIIMLTMHKSEDFVATAFESGVRGYVLKENAVEELIEGIRRVYEGGIYISPTLSKTMLAGFLASKKNVGKSEEMSLREREVLKLLAEGYSNKEIADFLLISVKTVETHRANIMRKNNFRNITELVLYAVRNHIIEI